MTKEHYCATIGNYDGVHRGHRMVLERLKKIAEEEKRNTMVITFDKHPMAVTCPERTPRPLMTTEEKVRRLYACGIDRVVVLTFDKRFMQQTAYDFMKHTLFEELDVRTLLIGYDNRFGKRNEKENAETDIAYGKEIGINVFIGPGPEECGLYGNQAVSSSLIRKMIDEGKIEEAMELM